MNDLFIKNNNILQRMEFNDIYYFTKKNNRVIAVTEESIIELNISLYTLSELLEKNPMFFRTHKSYIVNIHKIESIHKFNNKSFNIKFRGIEDIAFITQNNLKILSGKFLIL